jgi:sulfhydrogenase subunit delta
MVTTETTKTPATSRTRPRVAVWKFASCDGCQFSLVSAEDELLTLAGEIEIAYFLEVTRDVGEGPYDVSIVEGSITTPGDVDRIQHVREISDVLVTIGACATAGGIQALRNHADMAGFRETVYAGPTYVATLATSTAIADHVPVDLELRGCPVETDQLVEVISALLAGRRPVLPTHSVCVECKLRDTVCVAVADGLPCLGPVTQAGCGARCPAFGRACYGCFGPMETPNTSSLADHLTAVGATAPELVRLFRTFNTGALAFSEEAARHEHGQEQP